MKILSKCQSCKQRKLFIKRRTFKHKVAGTMTSQSLLCGKCFRGIIKMIT